MDAIFCMDTNPTRSSIPLISPTPPATSGVPAAPITSSPPSPSFSPLLALTSTSTVGLSQPHLPPTSSPSSPPLQSPTLLPIAPPGPTHPMITCAKDGISKKKVFCHTHHPLPTALLATVEQAEPTPFTQAVKHSEWRHAMSKESTKEA